MLPAPQFAESQPVMKVDHRGVGSLQRRLGQEKAADVLQHVGGDAVMTLLGHPFSGPRAMRR
jgi:hypothetical protein